MDQNINYLCQEMKKYDQFINESKEYKINYTENEQKAVLHFFNAALYSFIKTNIKFPEDDKPTIKFNKDKDWARVQGINIKISTAYSKDFESLIKEAQEIEHNSKEIIKWNKENESGMIRIILSGGENDIMVLGPTLYLEGKMSELLETEEAKNYIRSAKGGDKFNL